MKKLLKSEICRSVNSAWMYCSPWKSQYLQLLFNEQWAEAASAFVRPHFVFFFFHAFWSNAATVHALFIE